MKVRFPWLPRPEDLNSENFNYPEKLDQLIDAIFKNQPDRLKLSIMQDLVYNVTRGRVKTPKCEEPHEQHRIDQYTEQIRSRYLLHPAYGNPD